MCVNSTSKAIILQYIQTSFKKNNLEYSIFVVYYRTIQCTCCPSLVLKSSHPISHSYDNGTLGHKMNNVTAYRICIESCSQLQS